MIDYGKRKRSHLYYVKPMKF